MKNFQKYIIVLFLLIAFLYASCSKNSKNSLALNLTESEVDTGLSINPSQETKPKKAASDGQFLNCDLLSETEKEQFLIGAWDIYFPTPNSNWGHRFLVDYTYKYVDFSRKALLQRYWYTDGLWRIVGNDIQIKILSYRMSDRDAVNDEIGFGFPDGAQYITVPIQDDNWYTIGTLESIAVGIIKEGLVFPPRIALNPILFDKVSTEEYYYYRDRP